MGPKRKNNKNSRGGRGAGKVASRVAQFEAAANADSKPVAPSKPIKEGDSKDEASAENRMSASVSSVSISEVDSDQDTSLDRASDPSDSLARPNKRSESLENTNLSRENGQNKSELRGKNGTSETAESSDNSEKPEQAGSTEAEPEKLEHEKDRKLKTLETNSEAEEETVPNSTTKDSEKAKAVASPKSTESPIAAEPEVDSLTESSPPSKPDHSISTESQAKQADSMTAQNPNVGSPKSEEVVGEIDKTANGSAHSADSDVDPNSLEVGTLALAPSPMPDEEEEVWSPDDEDDGVEIIETQNVTRVSGARPSLVKPVLVGGNGDNFHANIDPNTYFADPEDAVIEEAKTSPNSAHPPQRVVMVGGSASIVSPSTASSVQMVQVGQKSPVSPHKLIRQSIMKPKEVQVPVATSLSEDAEILGVAVVGFHHTRGPEVEYWVGPDGDQSHLWPYLPFQSLPDGSHSFEESVCYFTLLYDRKQHRGPNPTPERDEEGHIIDSSDFNDVTTLFAVSCSRQVATADLEHAPEDATRSSIHKSIVVVARKPVFSSIKEKLTVVTRSYFEQGQFDDRTIIDRFYENLVHLYSLPQSDSDFQVGINVRDFVYRFGANVMVIFKALLMEKRILFYAADTDLLCTFQFALISLIPNLLNHLEDCGSPLLSNYETNLVKPTYMQSSNRESMLKFMGLPLHVFAAGGIFNPFVPLQQLDELTRKETQYGLFGSTNQLFLTATKADIIVNIDQNTVDIVNSDLTSALALSSADKTFIQPIASAVVKSWDGDNKWQPRSLGYLGSDDYIRQQFEDYLLGLLASVKYEAYLQRLGPEPPKIFTRDFAPNPLKAFNLTWAAQWKLTNNYRIFNKFTDDELFDIVEPAHVATIKNRARIDAISDPTQSPAPKEDKVKGFFSGLFRRSTTSEKSIAETAPNVSSPSTPTLPSTPTKMSDTEETAEEAPAEAPPSPRKLMFWR